MPFCVCFPAVQNGQVYSQWIGTVFRQCVYTNTGTAAYIAGTISVLCFLVALLPQIVAIYQNQSVKGISFSFTVLRLIAGACMFMGSMLTNTPLPITLIGLWILLCNVVILSQIVYYRRRPQSAAMHSMKEPMSITTLPTMAVVIVSMAVPLAYCTAPESSIAAHSARSLLEMVQIDTICDYRPELSPSVELIGIVLSWITSLFFMTSRLPQIWVNYTKKEVTVSLTMLGLLIVANVSMFLQLILVPFTWTEFFRTTLPFILSSLGLIAFDTIIFCQAICYRQPCRYC